MPLQTDLDAAAAAALRRSLFKSLAINGYATAELDDLPSTQRRWSATARQAAKDAQIDITITTYNGHIVAASPGQVDYPRMLEDKSVPVPVYLPTTTTRPKYFWPFAVDPKPSGLAGPPPTAVHR